MRRVRAKDDLVIQVPNIGPVRKFRDDVFLYEDDKPLSKRMEVIEENVDLEAEVEAKAAGLESAPEREEEQRSLDARIREALEKLDTDDDDHWTGGGLPRMDVVQDFLGEPIVTRENVGAAYAGFCRETATPKTGAVESPDEI